MAETESNFVISGPDPEYPGWNTWKLTDPDCYNSFLGRMIVRCGGEGLSDNIARVRMFPERKHRNLGDAVHGGTMMGFIDCSLFAAMRVLELGPSGYAVTLELQTHFLGSARMDEPLEAQIEITRETGRFLFMRGLVVQGDRGQDNMASFTAIVKKAPNQKTDLQ